MNFSPAHAKTSTRKKESGGGSSSTITSVYVLSPRAETEFISVWENRIYARNHSIPHNAGDVLSILLFLLHAVAYCAEKHHVDFHYARASGKERV
jgi:hypothetical protein